MKADGSSSPFPRHAFEYLEAQEDRHWWFRARNKIILWILIHKASAMSSFLEVGCGTGFVISGIAKAFPALRLEASEYFEDGLAIARQRVPSCAFRRLDATAMTEVEVYDCIGCFDVLEHIEADECVLSNFNQALRAGGYLLLTVPQHPWLWSSADTYAHHIRRYTQSQLRAKVMKSGFRVCYCSSFVSLLLPLMALQRLTSRHQPYDPDNEFKISPFLNQCLYLVMQIETFLLRLGFRFPAGGSLLLLAQKP